MSVIVWYMILTGVWIMCKYHTGMVTLESQKAVGLIQESILRF